MSQKTPERKSQCTEDRQCPRCKFISTDLSTLRCPRCMKLLLPECGCSGSCFSCSAKKNISLGG